MEGATYRDGMSPLGIQEKGLFKQWIPQLQVSLLVPPWVSKCLCATSALCDLERETYRGTDGSSGNTHETTPDSLVRGQS